jgi:hypothetical protein
MLASHGEQIGNIHNSLRLTLPSGAGRFRDDDVAQAGAVGARRAGADTERGLNPVGGSAQAMFYKRAG